MTPPARCDRPAEGETIPDLTSLTIGVLQLFARFNDAVWRQDSAGFAACFAPDGEWKIAGLHLRGRDEIAEACVRLLGRYERIHLITPLPILRLTGGNRAEGRHPMTEYARLPGGEGALTIGIYHDDFTHEGGEWLFARRFFSLKYRGPMELSGTFYDTPDYGVFPGRPAPDEATFVRKG